MSGAIAPAGLPQHSHAQHLPADFLAILCASAAALLVVLPIAAFALAVFLLINLPAGTSRSTRLMLATTAAIGLSMMTGARPLDPSAPNDIDVYYDIYQQLAAGHTEYLGTYGGGLEFAMPLLCWLWALLLPPLSVNGLMFCFALTSSVLLLVWVEKAFYLDRRWQDPALMGVCILMLNLYFSTQLVRQFLALIVLLYAITAQSRSKQWLYVALAATFHLTALPFYAIYLLARRGLPGWVALVVIAFAVRVSFWELVAAFDVVPVALADKLAYYVDNSQEFTDADLTSLRMIGLLGFVSLVALLSNRFRFDRKTRDWLAVPWVTAVMHLVLLPIPLASLRTTLMVHSVVPGLIAYQMLWRKAGVVLLTVLNVFFVYKIVTLIAAPDSGNLLPTVAMVGAFLT